MIDVTLLVLTLFSVILGQHLMYRFYKKGGSPPPPHPPYTDQIQKILLLVAIVCGILWLYSPLSSDHIKLNLNGLLKICNSGVSPILIDLNGY